MKLLYSSSAGRTVRSFICHIQVGAFAACCVDPESTLYLSLQWVIRRVIQWELHSTTVRYLVALRCSLWDAGRKKVMPHSSVKLSGLCSTECRAIRFTWTMIQSPCVIVGIEVQLIWSLKVIPSLLSVPLTCTGKQFSVEENLSTSWVDR